MLLLALLAVDRAQAASHTTTIYSPVSSGRFHLLEEPSGVTVLDDETFIVVEDESSRALRRLSLTRSDADSFVFSEHEQAAANGVIQPQLFATMDDLEGIAPISFTQFIVIGSHKKASRGKHPDREKIVLFSVEGDEISAAYDRHDFFDQIEKYDPALVQVMMQ